MRVRVRVRRAEWLLLGGLVGSRLVDGLVAVAALVLVVQHDGSALSVAGMTAGRLVPVALLGVSLVLLAHRRRRWLVLTASGLARSALAAGLALAGRADAVPVLAVVVLLAGVALVSAPYHAAAATLVPRVAAEDRLVAAAAAFLAVDGLAMLAAPAAAGALLLVAPVPVVLVGASLLALVVAAAPVGLPPGRFPAPPDGRRLADGLRLIVTLRPVRELLLVRGAVRVVLGVLLVVLALLPARLGLPAAEAGFLQAALGLGGVVTAVLLRRRLVLARSVSALAAGVVVLALACAALAFEPRREVLLVVLAVAGAADVAVQVTYRLALIRSLPAGVSVAVAGAAETVTAGGLVIGVLSAAVLAGPDSTAPATLAACGLLGVVLVLLLPSVVRSTRRAEQRGLVSRDSLAVLADSTVLKGLPATSLARLAEVGQTAQVGRGTLAVREGDPADAVFILLTGRMQVHVSDLEATRTGRVQVLLPGALFGEVGVLHRRPRTANVVALENSTVLELPAPLFLEAISAGEWTGSAVSRQAEQALDRSHRRPGITRPAPTRTVAADSDDEPRIGTRWRRAPR